MKDEGTTTKRFWVSWTINGDKYDSVQANGKIPIDVWCTGTAESGDCFCAVVDAVSETAVWRQLGLLFGRGMGQRFITEKESDWAPPSDRFPGFTNATKLADKPNRYVKVKERKTTK